MFLLRCLALILTREHLPTQIMLSGHNHQPIINQPWQWPGSRCCTAMWPPAREGPRVGAQMLALGEKHLAPVLRRCTRRGTGRCKFTGNLCGWCPLPATQSSCRASEGFQTRQKWAGSRCSVAYGYSSGLGQWFTAGIHWKGKALPANV